MNDDDPFAAYRAQVNAYFNVAGAGGSWSSSYGMGGGGGSSITSTAFYRERYGDWPEDPDDGSAGVREPRRPLPSAPSAAAEVEIVL